MQFRGFTALPSIGVQPVRLYRMPCKSSKFSWLRSKSRERTNLSTNKALERLVQGVRGAKVTKMVLKFVFLRPFYPLYVDAIFVPDKKYCFLCNKFVYTVSSNFFPASLNALIVSSSGSPRTVIPVSSTSLAPPATTLSSQSRIHSSIPHP